MSQPSDGPITRRSARLAGKPLPPTTPIASPTRKSTRLARNSSSVEVLDETSQKSDAAKRLSFADVAEQESPQDKTKSSTSRRKSAKVIESSDEENSVFNKSPSPSPTRRSSRLARNASVEIIDEVLSQKSAAVKRLSFADVAEHESPKSKTKSPSATPRQKYAKVIESSDDEKSVLKKSPSPSPIRRSTRLARNASVEVIDEIPYQKTAASKRLSFADVAAQESPKSNTKSPSITPRHKSAKDVVSSDEEEKIGLKKSPSLSPTKKSPGLARNASDDGLVAGNDSVLQRSLQTTESPLKSPRKISAKESSDDEEEIVLNKSLPSPVNISPRSPRNTSVEVLDEVPLQKSAAKRLSFADVAEQESPKCNTKSPSATRRHKSSVEYSDEEKIGLKKSPSHSPTKKSPKLPVNASDEGLVVEHESASNGTPQNLTKSPSITPRHKSAKDVETSDEEEEIGLKKSPSLSPTKKSPGLVRNASDEGLVAGNDSVLQRSPQTTKSPLKSPRKTSANKSSDDEEEIVLKKSQTPSPTNISRGSSRSVGSPRNASVEVLDEVPSQKSTAAKRLSFADVAEHESSQNKVKSPLSASRQKSAKVMESSDDEKSILDKSPSPSPTRRSSRLARNASVEVTDNGPSQKSAAAKRLSFADVASQESPKSNTKSPAITPRHKSAVEYFDEEKIGLKKSPSLSPTKKSSGLARNASDEVLIAEHVSALQGSPQTKTKSPLKSPRKISANESSDDEEEIALKKSQTPSPTKISPGSSRSAESPRNASVELFDEETSQKFAAAKRLSFADVVEHESTLKGTPQNMIKSQSITPRPKCVESSDEEEIVLKKPLSHSAAKKSPRLTRVSVDFFPVENSSVFFKNRGKNSSKMLKNLCQTYYALNSMSLNSTTLLSDELIVKENDNEIIWQQISLQNKAVFKEVKNTLKLFGDDLKIPEENVSDESEEEANDEDQREGEENWDESEDGDEPPLKKKKTVDLFNIRPQDLKNLDSKLRSLEFDEDDDDDEEEAEDGEEEEEEIAVPPPKKAKKSAVDDKFFSLSDMEKFLDEQEAGGQLSDIEDDDDDNEDFETDYRYKDFFEESASKKKNGKKVHFQQDEDGEEGDEMDDENDIAEDDDEEMDEEEAPVLLSTVKDVSKPSSSHEMSREKMLKMIDKIQAENLNPRSWELSGEVKGDDREVNSLLQKYVEADFRKKQPPINSKEKSDKIYSICLRRFKDKLFDDVVRKYREDDSVQAYRNLTVDMNERKSLMDVYEDKYQAAQNGESGGTEDIDPQVKDIQKNMNELFYKLDALSHLQFAPARIGEEIRMVKNMPSMRAEEVGPMASAAADETLMAPEEISRHVKKAPKSKDERTTTDKNQERRKKKRKQSDMAKAGKMPKVGKDKEEAASSSKTTKKGGKGKDFFAELQNVAAREIKEKKEKSDGSLKKRKKPKDKGETAAKYKA